MLTEEKGYLIAWPIFGTSNQLLASLILLAISVWLIKNGKNALFTIIPMLFMMVMTMWSLVSMVVRFFKSSPEILQGKVSTDISISGICGIVLLVLSLIIVLAWLAQRWRTAQAKTDQDEGNGRCLFYGQFNAQQKLMLLEIPQGLRCVILRGQQIEMAVDLPWEGLRPTGGAGPAPGGKPSARSLWGVPPLFREIWLRRLHQKGRKP